MRIEGVATDWGYADIGALLQVMGQLAVNQVEERDCPVGGVILCAGGEERMNRVASVVSVCG